MLRTASVAKFPCFLRLYLIFGVKCCIICNKMNIECIIQETDGQMIND
jgi:hypothetical protein